jgi:predicted protein tyrosine phosphatase
MPNKKPKAPSPAAGSLHVCPLSQLERTVEVSRARRLVTVINDGTPVMRPAIIASEHHLRLSVNDITLPHPGLVHPSTEHIEALLAFVASWGGEGDMVVHCWAGISRSTAAAFVALCALNPEVAEDEIATALRAASPTATPNALMVEIADEILSRRGRMIEAIEGIGHGEATNEGRPFSLPSRLAAGVQSGRRRPPT